MPHDKKGRLIEVGDLVKAKPYNYNFGRVTVGHVVCMREGQTCSGDFAFLRPWQGPVVDAFGADEAEIILKADGSDPVDALAPADEAAPDTDSTASELVSVKV